MFFKYQYITMPEVTKVDVIVRAAQQLSRALQNVLVENTGEASKAQLDQLACIFMESAKA